MGSTIELGDIKVDVLRKDIKNIHLSVYPPLGNVRISAPLHMSMASIRVFAISKLGWIKREQAKIRAQERESPRECLDRESHYLWGERYLLKVVEKNAPPKVELKHRQILLQLRPGTGETRKQKILEEWYRGQLKAAVPALLTKWETLIGVRVARFFVRRMKTRWGSCNHRAKSIRLNTDLARKPVECLEYIIVHELVHLLEPSHNRRFISLMDRFMPAWAFRREELNRLPVRHEDWVF